MNNGNDIFHIYIHMWRKRYVQSASRIAFFTCEKYRIALTIRILFFFTYIINNRKCFVRIFIHSLQNFGKLTRFLRSLVHFPKFCISWIKICTAQFLWSNLYLIIFTRSRVEAGLVHTWTSQYRWDVLCGNSFGQPAACQCSSESWNKQSDVHN